MPPGHRKIEPRTFFLNETHELATAEKPGGGRAAQYAGISWAARATQVSNSLRQVVDAVKSSHDPLKDDRYFVIAQPVPEVVKRSADKKKAPKGTFKEETDFGGQHARVFDRLGLDLLQVTDDGKAVVHADVERMEQLVQRSASLDELGVREQARWVTIDSFETIPLELRVDSDWVKTLKSHVVSDIVIELQPVLTRIEADRVLRAITDLLVSREGEKLTGTGTDFSGRHWFRGKATQRSVRAIAKDFFSIQAVHSPLYSIAAGKAGGGAAARPARAPEHIAPPDARDLPCVAVVDLGIPTSHKQLAAYRRGQFVPQNVPNPPIGDHGGFVASRVIFGDCPTDEALSRAAGRCSFYDVMVGDFPDGTGFDRRVSDKAVLEALRGVRGAAPDVRVFNLSFGDARPIDDFPTVVRTEKRRLLQDLDNFAFANDAMVVVAAGNSAAGDVPNPAYPDHHRDARWALGPWACGFNTLICGSLVSRLSANGMVRQLGWPSPFTRIGPGLCKAPVPSFSAAGGNTDDTYNFRSGMGVWGYSNAGLAEDRIGTSYSAPLLAREAAFTIDKLQQYCMSGSQPFAVLARAFLALTATPPSGEEPVRELAERTLGYGNASASRLFTPAAGSAVFLWQGYIESRDDIVRVQLPIPRDWLRRAQVPMLRLIICSDPPVNQVAQTFWACRKVQAVVRPHPDERALRAPPGAHVSYPLMDRRYKLARYKPDGEKPAVGDTWLIELSYEEIAPYLPASDFDPRQRVAFAAELSDDGAEPIDPQQAIQALPIANSMIRLSMQPTAIRSPIIVRTR